MHVVKVSQVGIWFKSANSPHKRVWNPFANEIIGKQTTGWERRVSDVQLELVYVRGKQRSVSGVHVQSLALGWFSKRLFNICLQDTFTAEFVLRCVIPESFRPVKMFLCDLYLKGLGFCPLPPSVKPSCTPPPRPK